MQGGTSIISCHFTLFRSMNSSWYILLSIFSFSPCTVTHLICRLNILKYTEGCVWVKLSPAHFVLRALSILGFWYSGSWVPRPKLLPCCRMASTLCFSLWPFRNSDSLLRCCWSNRLRNFFCSSSFSIRLYICISSWEVFWFHFKIIWPCVLCIYLEF